MRNGEQMSKRDDEIAAKALDNAAEMFNAAECSLKGLSLLELDFDGSGLEAALVHQELFGKVWLVFVDGFDAGDGRMKIYEPDLAQLAKITTPEEAADFIVSKRRSNGPIVQ